MYSIGRLGDCAEEEGLKAVWWWVGFRFAGGAGAGAAAVVVIVGIGFVDDIVSWSGEEQGRVCKIRGRWDQVLSQIS